MGSRRVLVSGRGTGILPVKTHGQDAHATATGSVLITGAAGFLGGACVREFLSRGWSVTSLVHRREPIIEAIIEGQIPYLTPVAAPDRAARHTASNRVSVPLLSVRASICDRPALAAALDGAGPFDAVVHCAGRASDVGRDRAFRRTNLQGVQNVIACMPAAGIGRLVHVSTTDVYGIRDFSDADENTPLADNRHNRYPKYKILAERAIADELPPDRVVILRPGAVWGPGDTTIMPRVLKFLSRCPAIVHFGNWRGRNRWPLAHVRNVATAACLAATCDDALGEAYNVVDPERTTVDEYYRMLVAARLPARRPLKSITLPFALGWLAGTVSEVISNAIGASRPIFEPSRYGLYSVSCDLDFSSAKLQRLFTRHGRQFVTRRAGMEELARTAVCHG